MTAKRIEGNRSQKAYEKAWLETLDDDSRNLAWQRGVGMAIPDEKKWKKPPEVRIKICGLTSREEVRWVVEEKADYAGFVLFFPKSKRNLNVEQAGELLRELKCLNLDRKTERTRSVAVVVSPTKDQIRQIECLGFDYIQIHGGIEKEAVCAINIPVIRAIHITDFPKEETSALRKTLKERIETEREYFDQKITAFLFDAKEPGSGKMFDWNMLRELRTAKEKMILAGGLDPYNVREALNVVCPDVVDVSSGVEISRETIGKDREKIRQFIRKVRTDEQ